MKHRRPKDREAELHKAEKRRKRMVLFGGIFMIFLMVFSFASVILYAPTTQNQMEYGDYEFRLETRPGGGQVLVTELQGQEVEFQNLPIQVAYMQVDPQAVQLLKDAQQVALAADPNLSVDIAPLVDYARLQLALAIPKSFPAMTAPDPQYQLPVLTCAQATQQVAVLTFNVTNATAGVTADGPCIVLSGTQQDMLRLKDRLIFEYYDILQDGQVPEE